MIITRAVDISIQAVSPLSIVELVLRVGAPGVEAEPGVRLGEPAAGARPCRRTDKDSVRWRERGPASARLRLGVGRACDAGLLEQVDHAGDDQADDRERDERLRPHRDLGPRHHRHRVGRAERVRRREPDVQVVDELRAPARRRQVGLVCCGKAKSGYWGMPWARAAGPPPSNPQYRNANATLLPSQTLAPATSNVIGSLATAEFVIRL